MSGWRVTLTSVAKADLDDVVRFTRERFGPAQTRLYRAKILVALRSLRDGPEPPGSMAVRDRPGLRRLSLRRPARHVLIYRILGDRRILVLRLLHDAMDFARHLPADN